MRVELVRAHEAMPVGRRLWFLLAAVLLALGCSSHATPPVVPARPPAAAVVPEPSTANPTASAQTQPADVQQPEPAPVRAPDAGTGATLPASGGIPPGVHTFAGFRQLTPADLDDDFGEHIVHAKADAPVQVVSSCRTFLALPFTAESEVELENELEERSFWFSVMDCAAWGMVQTARAASHTRLDALVSAKDPTRLLPPLLTLTDFLEDRSKVEAAAAKCRSWKAFDASLRVKNRTADGFEVRAEGWLGKVQYLARADFDGDGVEDLLVRREGGADGGSYRAVALFLLSQTDQDRCIRVTYVFGLS
ncbi:MAG TPA: hypothetical protein VJV78_47005 [Polyangiales bacterium]|nr:hypothetical protein [Polyangiales bacterium]